MARKRPDILVWLSQERGFRLPNCLALGIDVRELAKIIREADDLKGGFL